MYNRLTKTTVVNGKECISCIGFGTEMCHLHNGEPNCIQCPVLGAILNQLHSFEDIIESEDVAVSDG